MRTKALWVAPVVALVMLAAVGCTNGEKAGDPADTSIDLTDVTVGVLNIVDAAPLFIAIEDGTFVEHGLKVTAVPAAGGAEATASLVSGDTQFGFGSYVAFILSAQQGVGLTAVGPVTTSSGDSSLIMVRDSESIDSVKDLAGRKVAVSALTSIGSLGLQAQLKQAGIDPRSVTFVEMPMPNGLASLGQGQVDAAWLTEPFVTQALNGGGIKALLDPFGGELVSVPITGYVASSDYVKKNPDIAKAFQDAMAEATEKARKDDSVVRKILPSYTGLPADEANAIKLPGYSPSIDWDELQKLADIMEDLGITQSSFDVSRLAEAK